MNSFRYMVMHRSGVREPVSVEADNDSAARDILRRRGDFPIRRLDDSAGRFGFPAGKKKFNAYEFTRKLAPLLTANIPLERALSILEEDPEDARDSEVLRTIRKSLQEGKSFSAITRELKYFPAIYPSLVETGEAAGCLPEIMEELKLHLKRNRDMRDFVISSSIYPCIVLGITFLVVILLFTVFVPRFAAVFADMGRELPLLTRIMLNTGEVMKRLWWLLIPAGLLIWRMLSSEAPAAVKRRDSAILRCPLLGDLARDLDMGLFFNTLAIMVKRHVHLLSAIRISRQVLGNSVIAASLSGVEPALQRGEKLSQLLGGNPFAPHGARAMLRIAEESGEAGEMLRQIASELQDSVRRRIGRLLALLEPAVIIFLAAVVLMVVLSIFLAIMEMNKMK